MRLSKSCTCVFLAGLITLCAVARVQGQLVGADCASRGPDVCRECCSEKFQLGTIIDDPTCSTLECSPFLSTQSVAPAAEPPVAERRPVRRPVVEEAPVAERRPVRRPVVVEPPAVEEAPVAEPRPARRPVVAEPPVAEEAPVAEPPRAENPVPLPGAAAAASRQADTVIENAEARDGAVPTKALMSLAAAAAAAVMFAM